MEQSKVATESTPLYPPEETDNDNDNNNNQSTRSALNVLKNPSSKRLLVAMVLLLLAAVGILLFVVIHLVWYSGPALHSSNYTLVEYQVSQSYGPDNKRQVVPYCATARPPLVLHNFIHSFLHSSFSYALPTPLHIHGQAGKDFFHFYNFFQGKDPTLGYNMYVNQQTAEQLGIYNVTTTKNNEYIYLKSSPTPGGGKRNSIRLEGKTLFNSGLFILDVQHMPVGCGVWPAFWMTNEKHWPKWGEVDIMEGINNQPMAKTALHTSEGCLVNDTPPGINVHWDTAADVPLPGGGVMYTPKNASNCWHLAFHQWANQGCVEVNPHNNTLGVGLNQAGGGVFVLEWNPTRGYIRSWAFVPHHDTPQNLRDAISTAKDKHPVRPDPNSWPAPYGYFPIGEE